ncbi:cation:proton antiporter [Intestinimonas sp.]|uniref:cation:proton antiporter n=1 Tax=Intestinimonas sp. TaxID=1965293 RepID=UPI00261DE59F|nr:cation:proton antiporter [Intestinimonas sp.]
MESYDFILSVAIILAATKLLGMATKRIAMPQVVGALLAGLILGPACLGLLRETEFLNELSELGVIVLMFTAGLETDVKELKKSGGPAFLIALIGVLVPLAGGTALAALFHPGKEFLLQHLFIGVILTATSVSITVETLREMGRLSTRSGNAILGAALIDDVLGIVGLTLITSMADPTVSIFTVLLKIAAFFVLALVGGMAAHRLVDRLTGGPGRDRRRYAVLSLAFCMLCAYIAEVWFGVADITGAYVAGVIISNTNRTTYIASKCEGLSDMLLSPCFFASIGAKVVLPHMTLSIVLFSVLLMVWAIVSKIVGCGLGAKLCRYTNRECVQIGVGMISRGEVALIVANKGIATGLMTATYFGPVVIMVAATTIVTPILLKLVYKGRKDYGDLLQTDLVDHMEDVKDLEDAAQSVLDIHTNMLREGETHRESSSRDC